MKTIFIYIFLLTIAFKGIAQQIDKIDFQQGSETVAISYSISGAQKGQSYANQLYISQDGGKSFTQVSPTNLSGDLAFNDNKIDQNGKFMGQIQWNVSNEKALSGGDKILFKIIITITVNATTNAGGVMIDKRDKQQYNTVKINDQIWMSQNLNFKSKKSKVYKDDSTYAKKTGRLYSYEESKNVCPDGWHLPTNDEWVALFDYLEGWDVAGGKLKSKTGWAISDAKGTDDVDFKVLPGGYGNEDGTYNGLGQYAYFWFTNDGNDNTPKYKEFRYNDGKVIQYVEEAGFLSVRCIKNNDGANQNSTSQIEISGTSRIGVLSFNKKLPFEIKWISPLNCEVCRSDSSIMEIEALLTGNSEISSVIVVCNEKHFTPSRGYNILEKFEAKVKQKIELNEGENLVYLLIKTKEKEYKSLPISIMHQKANKKMGKRMALVIGNSNYPTAALRNPENDANAINDELTKLGFEVSKLTNCNYQTMKKAIVDFGTKLQQDQTTTGLFYYAGHGIQVNGENYLIPIDAVLEKDADVDVYAVNLTGLMSQLEYSGNALNIIILDACRNNPFIQNHRSTAPRGFNVVSAPGGSIVAYSTAPGSVAEDGEGKNGLYTQELIKALKMPGLRIEDVFKQVRLQVKQLSKGKQIPWENSSLETDFYFSPK